jgi:hypothetical protein
MLGICRTAPKSRSKATIRVIFDWGVPTSISRHVGCAPESGSEIRVLASVTTGRGGLMMLPGA